MCTRNGRTAPMAREASMGSTRGISLYSKLAHAPIHMISVYVICECVCVCVFVCVCVYVYIYIAISSVYWILIIRKREPSTSLVVMYVGFTFSFFLFLFFYLSLGRGSQAHPWSSRAWASHFLRPTRSRLCSRLSCSVQG